MEERRAGIGRREDRRVRRTKRMLENGLIQLLGQKPLRSITVRELTELVDINRGTFYLYYRDIYDMLEKLEEEYYERFMTVLNSHDSEPLEQRVSSIIYEEFLFMEENQEICRVLLGPHGDTSFLQRIDVALREKCREGWRRLCGHVDEDVFRYAYSYWSFGVMGIVRSWLERDCLESARMMAELTERCLRHGAFTMQ